MPIGRTKSPLRVDCNIAIGIRQMHNKENHTLSFADEIHVDTGQSAGRVPAKNTIYLIVNFKNLKVWNFRKNN
jgi:hypothetical protein